MRLTKIDIKHFRGIEELSLPLDDTCVLIGENNSGKTTVLDAIKLCLTRRLTGKGTIFEEYDYHLADASADPASAKPIEITLKFEESKEAEWPQVVVQRIPDAVQMDSNGLNSITLRVRSRYDPSIKDYATDYDFLDLSGVPLVKAKNPRLLTSLQQIVPTFHLASLRDAAQEFNPRSQFWSSFIRTPEIDEATRGDFESALSDLNQRVLDQHTSFEKVKERLKETAKLMPLGDADPVSIEAIPSRLFDILSRTQVNLAAKTGAKIPIVRHGSGTQSMAVIFLFDAFLQSQLESKYGKHAKPILTLEEPEAHLHTSAIKGVGKVLVNLPAQKIISTHSGELLASVPLSKVRRLCRKGGKINVRSIKPGTFTENEMNKLDYHVRAMRGSLLFSRCWLLVEGETEETLIPRCALAMGDDFDAKGVSCIGFAQASVATFIKLADALGIEWFVLIDNDDSGEDYKESAIQQLAGREEERHIKMLDHGAMETFLCMEGFGDVYEGSVSAQKRAAITAPQGAIEYWNQVVDAQQKGAKTRNALRIADRISAKEAEVPSLLKDVIDQVIATARAD